MLLDLGGGSEVMVEEKWGKAEHLTVLKEHRAGRESNRQQPGAGLPSKAHPSDSLRPPGSHLLTAHHYTVFSGSGIHDVRDLLVQSPSGSLSSRLTLNLSHNNDFLH